MCFSGLETLIFTLEFGDNWVFCQINWVSIPKFLKIIEYLLKTYFTWILPLSLALLYGLGHCGIGKACKENISGTAWARLLKFCRLFETNVKMA